MNLYKELIKKLIKKADKKADKEADIKAVNYTDHNSLQTIVRMPESLTKRL